MGTQAPTTTVRGGVLPDARRALAPAAGPRRLLAGLLLLALLLRLWHLGGTPPGLDADEASIGYNAYSLLRTGRDEYGQPLPLAFRAFGEYKRPAFIYATVPFVALFGPTPFGIRLPGAVIGTLSVGALYAVGVQLLRSRRLALAAAGMLAISPWHLQFSRGAREVSLLLLALLLLAACLAAALRLAPRRPARAGRLCLAAALALLLALYSYPGGVLVGPLLAAVLLRAYWPRPRRLPGRWAAAAVAVLVAGALPLAVQFADGRARARLDETSLLSDPRLQELAGERMARDRRDGAPWLLQHPLVLGARWAVNGYLAHFSPTYLFTQGDPEWRHHASDTGQLYLWDAPLLLAGLFRLARTWRRPGIQAVTGWLLVAPIPAALSQLAPHAVRSLGMLPALYLLAAAGLPPLWRWLRRQRLSRDWLLLLGLSVSFYLYMYHRVYPVEHDREWSSGWLEGFAASEAEVRQGRFRTVVVPPDLREGYLYALLGSGYDPRAYLAQGGSRADPNWPLSPEPGPLRFAPFEVRQVTWSEEPQAPDVLYVLGSWTPLPPGARALRVIKGASGRDAIQLAYFPAG